MKKILVIFGLFFLGACGFHPVYGVNKYTSVGAEEKLAQTYIENIPNREGQYLRNGLIDRFYRSGRPQDPQYRLVVENLRESIVDLDITKTSDSTRAQLRMSAGFSLYDARTGQSLVHRGLSSIVSYNILAGEFATRVSEDNARLNALNDLAGQIENHVSLYFKK